MPDLLEDLLNFTIIGGSLYSYMVDLKVKRIFARNNRRLSLILYRKIKLSSIVKYNIKGCYIIGAKEYRLVSLAIVAPNLSLKTKLSYRVIIYRDAEAVAKILAIIKKYPNL